MSKSPAITITSEELREHVEDLQNRMIPDKLWNRAEEYARRKIDLSRESYPDVTYYDNAYLMLLTSDAVLELEFADKINSRFNADHERS